MTDDLQLQTVIYPVSHHPISIYPNSKVNWTPKPLNATKKKEDNQCEV